MGKIKLTTTSKASTVMLYDLIKTNAVLSQMILKLQKELEEVRRSNDA
jgi:hypothetical protein